MSSSAATKELKNLLRSTKEEIDKKNYKEALKYLKKALQIDQNNYLVYVFAGFCSHKLELYENAETAYKRAVEIDSKNAQGWLGMAELYSSQLVTSDARHNRAKTNQIRSKLIPVYENVLPLVLTSDKNKWLLNAQKLAILYHEDHINNRIMKSSDNSNLTKRSKLLKDILAALPSDDGTSNKFQYMVLLLPYVYTEELETVERQVQDQWVGHLNAAREAARQKLLKKKTKLSDREVQTLMPKDEELITDQEKNELIAGWRISLHDTYLQQNHNTEYDQLVQSILQLQTDHKDLYCPVEDHERFIKRQYKRYLMLTPANENEKVAESKLLSSVLSECKALLAKHATAYYPLYLQIMMHENDDSPFTDEYISRATRQLIHSYPWEGLASIKLFELFPVEQQNTVYELEVLLQKGLKDCPDYISGWIDFAQLFFAQKRYIKATQCAVIGITQLTARSTQLKSKQTKLHTKLLIIQAQSLFKSGQVEESEKVFKSVLEGHDTTNIDAIKGLGEIEFQRHNYTNARKLYEKVLEVNPSDSTAHSQVAWLFFLDHQYEDAITCLNKATELNPNEFINYYRLGRCYWSMGGKYRSEKEYVQNNFFQSAKLNPQFSSNFTYLGMYYEEVLQDLDRAIKCYSKAVSLNPLEDEAGERLAEIYVERGQKTLAVALYVESSSKNPRAKWAWKRLAFYQQSASKYQESTLSFQSALRVDAKDALCWQGLADTYQREGKYLAALKAYIHAYNLDSSLVYSLAQRGQIHYLLQEYYDARRSFEQVLNVDPDFLTAYKGLAEVLFQMAKKNRLDGLFVKSAQNLIKGQSVLKASMKYECKNMQGVWKLLGDLRTYFINIPNPAAIEAHETFIGSVASQQNIPSIYLDNFDSKPHNQYDYIQLGAACYKKAIELDKEQMADNWYDLGVNYGMQIVSLSQDSRFDHAQVEQLRLNQVVAFKSAIRMNANSCEYWNGLGCAETNASIKQHCFIRALSIDAKNHKAWNNLGMLYMKHQKFLFAKNAFLKAQTIDPTSTIAWTGLAILNEVTNQSSALDRAAADFKHAVSLEKTSQATLGLAYLSFLQNDYLSAYESLLKYFQIDNRNPLSWNIFGLSLERQNKSSEAEEAFRKCLDLLPNELPSTSLSAATQGLVKKTDTVSFTSIDKLGYSFENLAVLCRVNLARILLQTGKYEESLELYKRVEPLMKHDIGVLNGLAMACYHLSRYDEAIKYLSSIFSDKQQQDIPAEDEQQLLLILASLYYRKKDYANSKSTLEQCMRKHPSFLRAYHSYAALCALTNAQNPDIALKVVARTYEKVANYNETETYILESEIHLIQGNPIRARAAIQKAIHLFPHRAELWDALASLVIRSKNILAEKKVVKHEPVVAKSKSKSKAQPDYASEFKHPSSATTPGVLSTIVPQLLQTSFSKLVIQTFNNNREAVTTRLYNIAALYYAMGMAPHYHNAKTTVEYSLRMAQKVLIYDPLHIPARELIASCMHTLAIITGKKSHTTSASVLARDYLKLRSQEQSNVNSLLQIHVALCENYIAAGEYTECMAHIKDLLSSESVANDAHKPHIESVMFAVLANCLHAKGETQLKYMKLFENSLKKEPQNAKTWMYLGDLFLQDRKLPAAEICYKTVCSILKSKQLKAQSTSTLFSTYCKLSLVALFSLHDQSDTSSHERYATEGLKYIRKALKLNNESPVAYLLYGKLCLLLQDTARASYLFQKAVSLDPTQPLTNLSHYKVHYQQENWEAAENDLWAERDTQPTNPYIYYCLANFAFESNAPEAALMFIQKAIFLNPSDQFYWDTLAQIQGALKPKKPAKQQQQTQQQNNTQAKKNTKKKK